MWKYRLLYLAALLGAVVFHAFYTGWFSWYLLMMALAAPLVSLLMTAASLHKATVRIDMPERVLRGEKALLTIEVERGRIAVPAVWAKIEITRSSDGAKDSRGCELSASAQNVMKLPTRHCAVVSCLVSKCAVLDYLRLFRLPVRTQFGGAAAVMPRPKQPEPPPDLSKFQSVAFTIKRSGGYAEVHEFREFRPGDSMRDVHWKLSSKTGELIVREPQEPEVGSVVVSLDLARSPKENDFLLDRAAWVCRWLIENGVEHVLCWSQEPPFTSDADEDEETETENEQILRNIRNQDDLDKALVAAIEAVSERSRDCAFTGYVARGAWHYHVGLDMLRRGEEPPADKKKSTK